MFKYKIEASVFEEAGGVKESVKTHFLTRREVVASLRVNS